jgi:hypothetical protein
MVPKSNKQKRSLNRQTMNTAFKLQKLFTIYNVPNCTIWVLPHVFQIELLIPSFIYHMLH